MIVSLRGSELLDLTEVEIIPDYCTIWCFKNKWLSVGNTWLRTCFNIPKDFFKGLGLHVLQTTVIQASDKTKSLAQVTKHIEPN